MRFQVETDRPLIANGSATRYVLATIVAPEGAPRQRPPVNLGLVLDRSGSMGGEKIRLAKDAAVAAIRRLDSRDRFCVVTYDDLVEVVVPSTVATAEAVKDAVRAIMSIEARGSTDLCGGWLRCCEQVALAQAPEAVTRVLLLTDGLANQGVTDHAEIIGHAGELRRRGVTTTTIGVGEDFDEHLLGRMADEGGGHFYFVERDEQIPRAIETEVGESLEVTLRGARLSVRFAGCGTVSPITSYPVQKDSGGCVIELGDLVSLQEVTVAMRVSFDREAISGAVGCIVRLPMSLSGASAGQSWTDAVWTIATGPEVGAQARNRSVDRAVAEAHASLARREAGRLNRDGDYAGARHQLTGVARRILRYAGEDSVLRGLVADLQHDAVVHDAPMAAFDRKARYMVSEQSLKGRDLRGAATRRPNRPGRPA